MTRKYGLLMARIVVVLAVIAAFVQAVPQAANAAGTPDVTLTETAPATVLYGTPATETLKATNNTATAAYNLTVSDILPAGVSYVAGSTNPSNYGAPTQIANAPSAGQTTLVWSNISDLQAGSSTTISFNLQGTVEPTAGTLYPGKTYSDSTSAYVNTNARTIPKFDGTGTIVAGSWTGDGFATGTTQIVPVTVTEDENSPEHELPRGVHNDKATYTVKVQNNSVNSTTGITVDEYLPADLEFLGCGGVDNTTSQTPEYPGSGNLTTGTTIGGGCGTATLVETKLLTPSGGTNSQPAYPLTAGTSVYTHVRFTVGTLAATSSYTFTYLAAVPLRANSNTWSNGVPAGATAQTANLDNNSGTETHDGDTLTNLSIASGTYSGTLDTSVTNPVSATYNKLHVEAVDLAIQKTVNNNALSQNTNHTWTLNYQTSEYRYTTSAVITDDLPNGECPINATNNYDDASSADCAPQAGQDPSTPYTSVNEQTAGDFHITWSLGTLAPNTHTALTFVSADRTSYQSGGSNSTPTVSNDTITNNVNIDGTIHGTCQNSGTPDPTCSGGGSIIYSGENTAVSADNASSATLTASAPVLSKKIALPPVGGTTDCTQATYVNTVPAYGKGDTICYQLKVQFPTGSHGKNVVITDMLPPNATYVPGSAHAVAPGDTGTTNTVTVNNFTSNLASGNNTATEVWTLGSNINGDLYVNPGEVFSYDIAMTADADPSSGNTFDIVDNLMKLSEANTAGQTISLRANQTFDLSRPFDTLTKGIQQVNSGTVNGPNVSPVTIKSGDNVTFRVDLSNSGLTDSNATAVTDTLPSEITSCAQVTGISDSGVCAGSSAPYSINWSGVTVPASGTKTLTYTVATSSSLAASESLTNTAAITSYSTSPNNGGSAETFTPGVGDSPTATDSATINLNTPSIAETLTTETNETGNNAASQATPGEIVDFTTTVTVPAGTSVYNAIVTNPLGSKYTYVPSSLALSLDGGAATGFTSGVTSNTWTVNYPSTFTSTTTDRVLTITYKGTLTTDAANVRSATPSDTSTLNYNDSLGNPVTALTASAHVTVVEPNIAETKTDSKSGSAKPGDTVTYTITVTNPTAPGNVSVAHDVVVTDAVPAGLGAPTSVSPAATTISGNNYTWDLSDVAPGGTATITYSQTVPNPSTASTSFANTATVNVTSLDTTASPGARTTGTGYSATRTDTVTIAGASITHTVTPTKTPIGTAVTFTATVTIPANTNLYDLSVIGGLGDGSTWGAYGTQTCTEADTTACSGLPLTQLGTPTKVGGTGATAFAWFIGDATADTQARTVVLTYTAYPAETNHSGTVTAIGTTIASKVEAYWDITNKTDPSTIPSAGSFDKNNGSNISANVTVTGPAVSLAKTVSTATPVPGGTFTYTVTATNANGTNNVAAYDLNITDTVPSGLGTPSNISNSGTYNSGTRVITWTLAGPLAVNASQTFTYDDTLAASSGLTNGQLITNSATLNSYDAVSGGNASAPSQYPNYGPTTASVDVNATFPSLSVAKTDAAGNETDPAFVGTAFGWKIVVSNANVAPASSTNVVDTLPTGWTYSANTAKVGGVTIAEPTISGQQLTFAIGTVTHGTPLTLTYSATPDNTAATGATANTNTAYAAGQDATGATANSTGQYKSANDTAAATIAAVDMSVGTTVSGSIVPGSPSTWNVDVQNLGPSTSGNPVTIVDTLPATVTSVSGTGTGWTCTPAANVVTCTHAAMASGDDKPLTVTGTLPSGSTGSFTNSAVVSQSVYDPVSANNTASVTTASAPHAVLTVNKAHVGPFTAGTHDSYTLTLHNNGPSDATNIVMTDPLPTDLSFISGTGTNYACTANSSQVITCTRTGALVSGSTDTVAINVAIASGHIGGIANTVTATSDDASTVTSTDTIGTVPIADDLKITKTHTGSFTAGTNGTYTLTVSNIGSSDANGPVTVTDTLPTGETFVSGSNTDWTCSASGVTVTCIYANSFVSASTSTISLVVSVNAAVANASVLVNTASVTSSTPDVDMTNNTATDPTTIDSKPVLTVDMTPPPSPLPGTNAKWTINVNNAGPSQDSGPITLKDTIPDGTDYVSATGTGWTCVFDATTRAVSCTRTTPLAPGVSAPDIELTLALGLTPDLSLTNHVSATSPTATPDPTNPPAAAQASTVTPITPEADLSLDKHHIALPAKGQMQYLLTATNNGPTADPGTVSVTDALPMGETFVSATGTGWTCTNNSGTLSCSRTGAVLGANPAITLTVSLDTHALPAVTNTATVEGTALDPVTTNQSGSDTTQVLGTELVRQTSLSFTGFNVWLWSGIGSALLLTGSVLEIALQIRRRRAV